MFFSILKSSKLHVAYNGHVAKIKQVSSHSSSITPTYQSPVCSHELKEIPTIKAGRFVSTLQLILNGGANYLHEHCDKRHRQLGPIYREYLGPAELIFIADTKLIQTVIAHEGQYPHHNVPEAWTYYNRLHKIKRGIFFQSGPSWSKLRKAFNKIMMGDAKKMTKFSPKILEINEDLLKLWSQNDQLEEVLIKDVKVDLCKWSIESVNLMLFGNRMGCICQADGGEFKADELVESVAEMFYETSRLQLIPVSLAHKLNLKTWRAFERSTCRMLDLANSYSHKSVIKIRDTNDPVDCLTKDLMQLGQLDHEEIVRSLVDLIIAAADTTSNSLQWMLYMLAKHQDVQSKLLIEAEKLLSHPHKLDNFNQESTFIKSFMKEVHRMYPTAPFLARTMDKDVQLGSHKVSAGKPCVFSLYTTSRSSDYFRDPLEFKPDRWLRESNVANQVRVEPNECSIKESKNAAYASLPFGVGARMCIGRRAAELQMALFIASFVKKFHSSIPEEDMDIGVKLQMILSPERPIRLKLRLRE